MDAGRTAKTPAAILVFARPFPGFRARSFWALAELLMGRDGAVLSLPAMACLVMRSIAGADSPSKDLTTEISMQSGDGLKTPVAGLRACARV